MILRIEDTDKKREVEGSTKDIIDMLQWSGLSWDEGPGSLYADKGETTYDGSLKLGLYGPYFQS